MANKNFMRLYLISILCLVVAVLNGQELPLGYISHFETNFTQRKLDENLLLSSNAGYKLTSGRFELHENSDTLPGFSLGACMLIDNNIFGDFIAETRLSYSGEARDSLSGVFIIAGLRDSTNYYYIRISEEGAFFNQVYKGIESTIMQDSTLSVTKDKPFKMRITRDILYRSIHIKYNGSEVTFTDPNLVMGYIGFGASGYKIEINSIKVWAPTSIANPAKVFR